MVCLPVRGTSPTSCAIKNVGTDPRISPIDIRLVRGTRRGFRTPHAIACPERSRRAGPRQIHRGESPACILRECVRNDIGNPSNKLKRLAQLKP